MANTTVYLKCDRNVEVQSEDVFMNDLGSLRCADQVTAAKLKALKVHHFGAEEAKRCVISSLKLVELMVSVPISAWRLWENRMCWWNGSVWTGIRDGSSG